MDFEHELMSLGLGTRMSMLANVEGKLVFFYRGSAECRLRPSSLWANHEAEDEYGGVLAVELRS
jgi:hypothetical protein